MQVPELRRPTTAFEQKVGSDSGGEEGATQEALYGSPSSWTFGSICGLAFHVLTSNLPLFAGVAAGAAVCDALGIGKLGTSILLVLSVGATQMVLRGDRDLSLSEVWSEYGGRWVPNIWTGLVSGMVAFGGIFAISAVVALATLIASPVLGDGAGILGGGLGLVLGLYGLGSYVRAVFLASHEVILGGQSGGDALRASYEVVDRNTNEIVLAVMGFGVISFGLTMVAAFTMAIPGAALMSSTGGAGGPMVSWLVCFPINLIYCWCSAATTLVYLREKAR